MKAIVKTPLHHDGKSREIGSEVELTDEQAKSLAAIGVVSIVSTVDVAYEEVPSGSSQEAEGKAQEEAPKTAKKTSKRRAEADDE